MWREITVLTLHTGATAPLLPKPLQLLVQVLELLLPPQPVLLLIIATTVQLLQLLLLLFAVSQIPSLFLVQI